MLTLALALAAAPIAHADAPAPLRSAPVAAHSAQPATAAPEPKNVDADEVVRLARGYPSWSTSGSWQGWFDLLRSVRGLNNDRPAEVGRG